MRLWAWLDARLLVWSALPQGDDSPVVPWQIWLDWGRRIPHLRPASPSAQNVRLVLLVLIAITAMANSSISYLRQAHTPTAVVEQYYDDLDFRRFSQAYARLDPQARPSYDQYLLDLSVGGGMVASYGKLNSVRVKLVDAQPDHVQVLAQTDWVTSLSAYPTEQRLNLVLRDGQWYIEPDPVDLTVPPERTFRRGEIGWVTTSRRRVVDEPTAFADMLDRPDLQILSARLVRHNGRYSVVGELINADSDPGDVTVTAFLHDAQGEEISHYNAQEVMIHKLFPKELTPFRVDFEGVAGAVLTDTLDLKTFKPGAFTPPLITRPVQSFAVYAKAVLTQHDLNRELSFQNLKIEHAEDETYHLSGQLLNIGTIEATIPHVLLTYYDAQNQVAWVDHVYIRDAIRPQRVQSFDIPLSSIAEVETISEQSGLFSNNLLPAVSTDTPWLERIPLPPETGFAALRISVYAFEGGGL